LPLPALLLPCCPPDTFPIPCPCAPAYVAVRQRRSRQAKSFAGKPTGCDSRLGLRECTERFGVFLYMPFWPLL
jgi:hypothetical protein